MRWLNQSKSNKLFQLRFIVELSFGWQGVGVDINPCEFGLTLYLPFAAIEFLAYRWEDYSLADTSPKNSPSTAAASTSPNTLR